MSIVNRRNAVLGWAVWSIGKRAAKKKAKAVVPSVGSEPTRRAKKPAVLAAVAAFGGALVFWRKKRGHAEPNGM